ncbi:MAG: peptide-methionine (R)-S-oxide reductase MsrB [Chlorobi bacterium]|nr:peptide-methionine (R)-S-oxide reductase MsrB [Chlorobiota bacterium]
MKHLLFLFLFPVAAVLSCSSGNTGNGTNPASVQQSSPVNPYYSRTDTARLDLPDSVWKKVLPPEVYEVARHAATERAFTGKYWDFEGTGTYSCAACGNALFRSDAKFSSTCGWPSFFETVRSGSVEYRTDKSYGMERTEVLCGRCGSHLGHVFDDGPPPTGKRFCMNSVVLDFEPDTRD